MKFTTTVAAILPTLAAAHYHFPQLIINDKVTGVYEYVREHDNGYMPSMSPTITQTSFRCNKGAEGHKSKPKAAKVTAGKDIIGFVTNVNSEIRHPGPLTVYLSKAPNGNVASYDGDGDWFKVWQLTGNPGFNGDDTTWLSWGKARFSFRLPAEIPAGQYLARVEHMAVHQPYSQKEFFFQCAHLDIASSYTGPAPGPLVKIPGVYTANDPALKWDSWKNPKAPWPQHGPNMWPNTAIMNTNLWGSPAPSPPPPSSGPPPSSPPSTPPSPPPSSPPPSGCAGMYAQCGGSGYTGPKCCSAGSCKMSNEWYSQCL